MAALLSASDIIDELEHRTFRPVLGGLPPLKTYMLTLDLQVQMAAWHDDDYTERTFFKYKSRSPVLHNDTIDAAKDMFLKEVTLSEYDGCDMQMITWFASTNGFVLNCVHSKQNVLEKNHIFKIVKRS